MKTEAAAEASVQLCAFLVGSTEYVIDLMRIEEILRPQRITPLPEAPAWVEGVLSLRGNLVPIVHLRRRLGLEVIPATAKTRLLVCWMGRRRVGFLVDRVTEVVRVTRGDIRPPPPLLAPGSTSYVVGVCGPPERLLLLLNLKALLTAARTPDDTTMRSTP